VVALEPLRYPYVQPVNRSRLLAGKLGALLVVTATATGCVLVAGLLTGLALSGWHVFHIIGAPSLATGDPAGCGKRREAPWGALPGARMPGRLLASAYGARIPHAAGEDAV
jgi:hypothetical protein